TTSPFASMDRLAGIFADGSASAAMRPLASTRMSATRTLRSGSMVTSVPPRMARTAELLAAAVRGAGIRGQQERNVVVRVRGVDVELDAHALQERSHAVEPGEVGRDVEHQTVGAGVDRAAGQV